MYTTYNFVDKDPIIDVIRTAMDDSKVTIAYIANSSGVSDACIRAWLYGKTKRPQHASIRAVLKALGVEIVHSYRGQEMIVRVRISSPAKGVRKYLRSVK